MMNKKAKGRDKPQLPAPNADALFDRVASILDQARSKVVQAVNSEMIFNSNRGFPWRINLN